MVLGSRCFGEVAARIEGQLELLGGSECSDVRSLVLQYCFERSRSPLLRAESHAEGLVWGSERVDFEDENEESAPERAAAAVDTALAPADSALAGAENGLDHAAAGDTAAETAESRTLVGGAAAADTQAEGLEQAMGKRSRRRRDGLASPIAWRLS